MKLVLLFTMVLLLNCYHEKSFVEKNSQVQVWPDSLEHPKYDDFKLSDSNYLDHFLKYDMSDILLPKSEFLGYISDDFRKINIVYTSINKNPLNPNEYNITGYSIVFDNKCDFSGTLKINQVRQFVNMHFGVDDEYIDSGLVSQGIIVGDYIIKENPEQKHSGKFVGIFTTYWYIDRDHNIKYDDIEIYSDEYSNNQYIGTWTNYKNDETKICNWGEYRIPFSGDLDVGSGEFSPDPKYYDKGWKDFIDQY